MKMYISPPAVAVVYISNHHMTCTAHRVLPSAARFSVVIIFSYPIKVYIYTQIYRYVSVNSIYTHIHIDKYRNINTDAFR